MDNIPIRMGHVPQPRLPDEATGPVSSMKSKMKGKDFRKGGECLRGIDVTDAFRVKEKDIRRVMK